MDPACASVDNSKSDPLTDSYPQKCRYSFHRNCQGIILGVNLKRKNSHYTKGATMTATHNHYLAVLGEDFVAQKYANEGYDITARNVSFSVGEIDIIATSPQGEVVFIEVKTRSSSLMDAAEAVTPTKMRKIHRAASKWLQGKPFADIRFDVVAVHVDEYGELDMTRYQGVEHGAC
ncbi:YraN family protein [Corynebacterium diphtheriae]|uniref:YraN family protein n=1 Tax=Corynebacterium diphtheriae TaxID=1717 RepID=UPI002ADD559D|nr:YraN family protein [Corynebacterium diphtheriae]